MGSATTLQTQALKRDVRIGYLVGPLAGISPRCTASTALINPATPAADSRWPRFDFTDPIRSGASTGRPRPSTVPRARASIGSPNKVPVPCASM